MHRGADMSNHENVDFNSMIGILITLCLKQADKEELTNNEQKVLIDLKNSIHKNLGFNFIIPIKKSNGIDYDILKATGPLIDELTLLYQKYRDEVVEIKSKNNLSKIDVDKIIKLSVPAKNRLEKKILRLQSATFIFFHKNFIETNLRNDANNLGELMMRNSSLPSEFAKFLIPPLEELVIDEMDPRTIAVNCREKLFSEINFNLGKIRTSQAINNISEQAEKTLLIDQINMNTRDLLRFIWLSTHYNRVLGGIRALKNDVKNQKVNSFEDLKKFDILSLVSPDETNAELERDELMKKIFQILEEEFEG